MSVVHEISEVLDSSGQVDMLFFDFSKAFDKVPHGKLIHKLECIGLPSNIISWIKAYLRQRQQFVEINKCSSSVRQVTSGVPQGSVLGPLLFLIYVNDITNKIPDNVHINLFADDCVIFKQIASPNDHSCLQNSVIAISDWCKLWGMEINIQKTVLLRVTRKKEPSVFSYVLNDTIITEVKKYKYLGVTFSNKLSWSDHISVTSSAALRKFWFLKRKLRKAPAQTKLLAYNTFVRSKLEYAAVVWDPHTKKDTMNLERVQRKAVRFIFGKYKRQDSPTLLMLRNKISSLERRRKVCRLQFLHSIISGKFGLKLPRYVTFLQARKTRHRHNLSITPIFSKTNSHMNSFFVRTINEWNSLPLEVLQSRNFLQELENYLPHELE